MLSARGHPEALVSDADYLYEIARQLRDQARGQVRGNDE
jgi:hypothetical protein